MPSLRDLTLTHQKQPIRLSAVDIFLHTTNKRGTLTCSWCIRRFCQRSVQNLVAYNSQSFLLSILSTFPPNLTSPSSSSSSSSCSYSYCTAPSSPASHTNSHPAHTHTHTHFVVERAHVWALTTSACESVRIQPVGPTQRRLGGPCGCGASGRPCPSLVPASVV